MWTPEQRRAYKRNWNRRNRGRYAIQEAKWKANNKQRLDLARHKRNLRKLYDISVEEYEAILDYQDGVCAICRRPPSAFKRRFHVDHNHETKAVRGILCHGCNVGLGSFQDNPLMLRSALEYLESR